MSRAFVKDDSPAGPVLIPPRAPLPEGMVNYVTPRGARLLAQEQTELEALRTRLNASAADKTETARELTIVREQLKALGSRIRSMRVVQPSKPYPDEVRFGATVRLGSTDAAERQMSIVGVDEADPEEGRLGFVAPVARALIGKRIGDEVVLPTPGGSARFVITEILYASNS